MQSDEHETKRWPLLGCLLICQLWATNVLAENSLEDLLEELLQVEVVSASKRSERLIDAPTSISRVTREEIQLAGVTSVAEALRLVPGMIVSEQRNGFYDINIRGFDFVPPDLPAHQIASKNILVMVDNRVVYDHTWGTVPWHDISLTIEDIEQIEVVRGPSSALYGPNAFTGVIHILTRRPGLDSDSTPTITARANVGNAGTMLAQASVGFNDDDHSSWSGRLSISAEQRERHQTSIYSLVNDQYQDVGERFPTNFILTLGPDYDAAYHFPEVERASDRQALNFFIHYDNNYGRTIDLDVGYSHDEFVKIGFLNLATPFNSLESSVYYGNFKFVEDRVSAQVYFNRATTQTIDQTLVSGDWINENRNIAATLGYEMPLSDNNLLQFEYRFNSVAYQVYRSDEPVSGRGGEDELPATLDSDSVSLRHDYRYSKKLRLINALNYDQFRVPDTYIFSFQTALTYQFTEKQLGRINISQANRVPFASEIFTDISFDSPSGFEVDIFGENDLEIAQTTMVELGLRGALSSNAIYDVEIWYQQAENFNALVFRNITDSSADIITDQLETTVTQSGLTLSVTHVFARGLNLSYSLTAQETTLFDYYENLLRREDFVEEQVSESTPSWIAMFNLNWELPYKIYANLNGYFMDERYLSATFFSPDTVDQVAILNTNFRYQVFPQWTATFAIKNMMDSQQREFLYTDDSRRLMLFGIEYSNDDD